MEDIKGISPNFSMHRVHLEDGHFLSIKPQRRLNPHIKDIVKEDILKILKIGIIYSISDSTWVSKIHVVSRKGGVTIVEGDNGEIILTCMTTEWHVCIEYKKLNKATTNDHFSLSFIN